MLTSIFGGGYKIIFIASHAQQSVVSTQSRTSFHSHKGLPNNAIYWKLDVFSMWLIKQKMFLPYNRCPWWIGLDQSCRCLTSYISIASNETSLEFSHNWLVDFKIIVSSFELKIWIGFEVIAFLLERVFFVFFHTFLRLT